MERSREAGAGAGGGNDDGGGVVLARYSLDVSGGGSGKDEGAVHQLARYSLDVSGGGGKNDGAVHQLARYSLDVSGGGGKNDGAVHQLTRYSLDVSGGGGKDDGAAHELARYSLDVSAGCGGRRSTLLDEYERLAFEAQLNSAILRRCFSEPSPARFVQPADAPPAPHGTGDGEGRRDEPSAAGRSWRLHEVVARWLEALKPVFAWLRCAWERRRKEQATPRGPPTMPRVQLLDYLC